MMFRWNSRVIKAIHVNIVNVFLISVFWGAVANALCSCNDPDIELIVECDNGIAQLRWVSSKPTFGFNVRYGCNSSASCSGGTKIIYYAQEVSLPDGDDKYGDDINNADFGNVICWFWVENKDLRNNPRIGCSEIVECNPAPASNGSVSPSSSVTVSEFTLPSVPSTLSSLPSKLSSLPSTLSASIPISSSSVISATSMPSSLSPSSSLTVQLPTVTDSTTIISVDSTAETTTTITVIPTATPTITSTNNNAATMEISSTLVLPSTETLFGPSENNSPDVYSLLLYITLCCTVIITLLIITLCLLFYWKKRKRKPLKDYQIEDVCCEDPGELAKESDSETETVANGNGIRDNISITDDVVYMLRKILDSDDISLAPTIFSDNEVDDGSVASHYRTDDGGVECSHYCGSGGHGFESNTSSSHRRSSSCSSVF